MLRCCSALAFLSSLTAQQFAPPSGRAIDAVLPPGRLDLVVFADADGDGDLDACVNDSFTNTFSFVRRNGSHAWTTTGLLPGIVTAAAFADFDSDGDLDLLVGAYGPSRAPIGILRNDGAGFTWTFEVPGLLAGQVTGFATGDIDRDGDVDVVVGLSAGVQVLRNNGTGALTAVNTLSSSQGARPVLFDRDLDGDLDLAVASPSGLQLFDNNAGVFTEISSTLPSTVATLVAAADFDRDGRVDLALAHGAVLDVLWNGATGWTLLASVTSGGEVLRSIAAGDLDRDGNLDLVVQIDSGADWLRNGSNRTFTRLQGLRHGQPATTRVVAAGDLTGRGGADVVCVWSDGTARVLYGNAPLPITDPMALPAPAYVGSVSTCIPAIGDVDGDGRPDMVIPNGALVVHNEGAGVLRPLPIAGARAGNQMARLGDLDGDGDLDLLLGMGTAPQAPFVPMQRFQNDGTGRFTPVQDIAVASSISDFAIADIDGDGDQDILIPMGNAVLWVQNLGAAGFAGNGWLPTVQTPGGGNRLVVADLDGDGRLDVIHGHTNASLPVSLGLGGGAFAAGSTIALSPGTSAGDIVAADVDRDGDLDLIINESGHLVLFRNQGAGTFTRDTTALPPNGSYGPLACVDVDEDGDLDLWCGSLTPLMTNDGTGMFTPAAGRVWSGARSNHVFFDYDEDGDVDIVYLGDGAWQPAPNRLRHAESVQPVRPGGALQVRFEGARFAPTAGTLAFGCFAFAQGPPTKITGLAGSFLLQASGTTVVGVFPMPTGVATWQVAVPANAGLLGLDLCTQGIVVGPNVPAGFTNLVHERILP